MKESVMSLRTANQKADPRMSWINVKSTLLSRTTSDITEHLYYKHILKNNINNNNKIITHHYNKIFKEFFLLKKNKLLIFKQRGLYLGGRTMH